MKGAAGCKRIGVVLVLLLSALALTGCWDRQELEERAVVLGIGIDTDGTQNDEEDITYLDNNYPSTKMGYIHVYVQIAVPGRIPLGPGTGSGGGSGTGGAQRTVWVLDGSGHTMDEAINNIQQRVSSKLFFGHLRVIAISESLAKKGIDNLNEYFRRNPEVRRMNWMVVCKGKAGEYLRVAPELERVPTLYLLTTMDQAVKLGRLPNDFLGVFWSNSSAKGQEGFLPYIELAKNGAIQISGLAYFLADKMVGVTEPIEIPLYMGIKGINPAGGQAYVKVPGSEEYVMFGARDRKVKTRVRIVDGKPVFDVKVSLEGNLLEKSGSKLQINAGIIKNIEDELGKDSKKSYEQLIRKTQEKSSDIFGFGEYVRAKKPFYWNREIQTKEKWQQVYKDLTVQVEVNLKIRRVGMKAN